MKFSFAETQNQGVNLKKKLISIAHLPENNKVEQIIIKNENMALSASDRS